MTIQDLLQLVIDNEASDLHLVVGSPPTVRLHGNLLPVEQASELTPEEAEKLITPLLSSTQKEVFLKNREVDFSYQYADVARFRVNVYFQRGAMAAALRLIPIEVIPLDKLRLPAICRQLTQLKQGLVLVTGPTGHGKSTTLAAMIDAINEERAEHILTIEDPIEFLYTPKQSVISQRELGSDTHSWNMSLRSALREDPDVVLIGEMRDFETIAAALTIAETGHLVFATLHTNSGAQTIDRIIDVFPEHQQGQVRMQLSSVLEAVIAQRLIPSSGGGRVPANEILLSTPALSNIIREGKTHQIDNVIQTSGEMGMMLFENSLAAWIEKGEVSYDVAMKYSFRPEELSRLVKGRSV